MYADDYINMADWLGMEGRSKRNWRPFEEAREYVRALELQGYKEWIEYSQNRMPEKGERPIDIPSNPSIIYADDGL